METANQSKASEEPQVTVNEDGSLTVNLSAKHAAMLAGTQKIAIATSPLYGVADILNKSAAASLRARGDHAKADELQKVHDTMMDRHEETDYPAIIASIIEATHAAAVETKRMNDALAEPGKSPLESALDRFRQGRGFGIH